MLSPDRIAFIQGGVAAVVATRSERLVPAISRGWGLDVAAETSVLDLCVTAPVGSPTRANLERHAAIAIAVSPPTIATALQVKGTITRVAAPDAEALERAERHLAAFTAEAIRVGVPVDHPRRLFMSSELVSVTVSVEQAFDQTPGPGAGRRL